MDKQKAADGRLRVETLMKQLLIVQAREKQIQQELRSIIYKIEQVR